jgi:methionyl-tRNA formyltransferase
MAAAGAPSLRLAFMGAPDFALPTLAALLAAGHRVAAVYSQPPRPAGRGQQEQPTPVAAFAAARGLPVFTPASLKPAGEIARFRALDLDAAVVVAYGLLLPPEILAAPRLGCLNLHASLLPRWRGAAPIQRAILAGDRQSGVSVMLMDQGLDTGPVLARAAIALTPATTGASLHDLLAPLGARLLVETLAQHAAGMLAPQPQPAEGVTYAAKLSRAESRIDWGKPALLLERQVRAFTPWPGSHFELPGAQGGGQRVKLLRAELAEGAGLAGTVLDEQLTVACGQGALRLLELQREGRRPQAAPEFLRGLPLPPGTQLR